MENTQELNNLIIRNIQGLAEKDKKEILNFIEYLKIKEDPSFIEYVNCRSEEAIEAKKRGERFVSLADLQSEYV